MRAAIMALAVAATIAPLVGAPALASEKADVLASVKKLADSQNKADMKAFVAACAPQAVIVDEFGPLSGRERRHVPTGGMPIIPTTSRSALPMGSSPMASRGTSL